MNWTEFFEHYQATELALQAYVEGLPLWVNIWRGWMFFIFTVALAFIIWKREARWVAAVMVVSTIGYNLVAGISGVGRFPSIAFVLLWTPLAIYLARRWPQLQGEGRFDRVYSCWLALALTTLTISLAFDFYNVAYSFIIDAKE